MKMTRYRGPALGALSVAAFVTALGGGTADAQSNPLGDTLAVLVAALIPPAGGYRPITEQGNNVAHPSWGTAGSQLLRGSSGAHYADGISTLAGPDRPSARLVSSAISAQPQLIPNSLGISDYIWTFGQFLDHDFGLTRGSQEPAPIAVPNGDPFFDPSYTGTQVIPFNRGTYDTTTGVTTPRQQVNEVTGFIDGSQIYGSDTTRATWLRTLHRGQLKVTSTSVGNLLPYNDGTVPNAGSPEATSLSTSLFVAGDIRSNEQPTLAALHILFVREHNRLASDIAAINPLLSDEEVYQRARAVVIAEYQHVVYDEFLPVLIGTGTLPPYAGYDPTVNAGVSDEFSGAGYRLGHTLLSPFVQRLNADGTSIAAGPLPLRTAFFSAAPPLITAGGIEPFLRGVAAQASQNLDNFVIDDVRNFLFGAPGQGGLDLISLNIQRGRELGLPDFNTIREERGLSPITSFASITSNPSLAAALAAVYPDVDDVDPFIGFISEDHVPGAFVGPTLQSVLVDQFSRSRAGDRFWYQNSLTSAILALIQNTKLSDIIARNTPITNLQPHVFYVPGFGGN